MITAFNMLNSKFCCLVWWCYLACSLAYESESPVGDSPKVWTWKSLASMWARTAGVNETTPEESRWRMVKLCTCAILDGCAEKTELWGNQEDMAEWRPNQ
jgi:hypothetical protein